VKKIIIAAGAAAFLAASTFGAVAAEVTGAITAVHPETHSVTLDDGHAYVMPDGIEVGAMKPGLRVSLTYEEVDGTRKVSAVASPG
jgi:hypothetical protein